MENLEKLDTKFFFKKKILVTGHTGFKGTWLTYSLVMLGAKVYGLSLPIDKKRNKLFTELGLDKNKKITNKYFDVSDYNKLTAYINKVRPELIFHLAAQPLVLESFKKPYETFYTNIIGTLNILEIFRNYKSIKSLMVITSDKVYKNSEKKKYFKEDDSLGGDDPYSSSKSCADLISLSYNYSFIADNINKGIATIRAGNVIGYGDYSPNRIFVDLFKSIKTKKIKIRNPKAVRPWQDITDITRAYLQLSKKLFKEPLKYSGSWNFGPDKKNKDYNVDEISRIFVENIKGIRIELKKNKDKKYDKLEKKVLKLDTDKSKSKLGFENNFNIKSSIEKNLKLSKDIMKKKEIEVFEKYLKENILK